LEAAVFELLHKGALGPGVFPVLLAPDPEICREDADRGPGVGSPFGPLLEPVGDGVLRLEVANRGIADNRRRGETLLLPIETTFDRPGKDSRKFAAELVSKLAVGLDNGDGERNQWSRRRIA
jgi:hypothetical protein